MANPTGRNGKEKKKLYFSNPLLRWKLTCPTCRAEVLHTEQDHLTDGFIMVARKMVFHLRAIHDMDSEDQIQSFLAACDIDRQELA